MSNSLSDIMKKLDDLARIQETTREMKKNQAHLEDHPVIGRVIKQQRKGIDKYGSLVNPNEKRLDEWIEHLQEELVDSHVYSEIIKQRLAKIRDNVVLALIALQHYEYHNHEELLERAVSLLEDVVIDFDCSIYPVEMDEDL